MQSDRNFLMGEYFKRKSRQFQSKYRFVGKTQQDFQAWKSELSAELKKQACGI